MVWPGAHRLRSSRHGIRIEAHRPGGYRTLVRVDPARNGPTSRSITRETFMNPSETKTSRRTFLGQVGGAAAGIGAWSAFPTIIPERALGADGLAPASERI